MARNPGRRELCLGIVCRQGQAICLSPPPLAGLQGANGGVVQEEKGRDQPTQHLSPPPSTRSTWLSPSPSSLQSPLPLPVPTGLVHKRGADGQAEGGRRGEHSDSAEKPETGSHRPAPRSRALRVETNLIIQADNHQPSSLVDPTLLSRPPVASSMPGPPPALACWGPRKGDRRDT